MYLADLGAEVWKIEHPVRGDDTRQWQPPALDGISAYFLAMNRGKQSVAIDFAQVAGAGLVAQLADRADVVVENFLPGALARHGLDCASLRARNPRLVTCTIGGYRSDGADAGRPGYDFIIQAESGLMAITGEPDGAPMRVGVAVADVVTGLNAATAILAALLQRARTGVGEHVEIALIDAATAALTNVAGSALMRGESPPRFGNAHEAIVPYQTFEAADGTLVVAVGNDAQFRGCCEALDLGDVAADQRFATNPARVANREALVELLVARLRTGTVASWLARLRAHGVPAGHVAPIAQALDARAADGDLIASYRLTGGGAYRVVGSPLTLGGDRMTADRGAPRLGEHTVDVLARELELSTTAIDELARAGTIGGA